MANSSVTVKTQKTTRDLLAAFTGNQRLVKLFENLSLDVTETIPDAMDQLQQDSDSTRFVVGLVQAIAGAALELAVQATEGPPRAELGEQADDIPVASPQIFEGFAVGMIAITVDPTNPAQTLGYGTWAAWGSGQIPVSYLAGDPDFGTVEATGGAKTKAISAHAGTAVADHVSHIHAVTSNVSVNTPGALSIATTAVTAGAGTFAATTIGGTVLGAGTTSVAQGAPTLNNNTVNTGGPGIALSHTVTQPSAHTDLNVLPPFIVAFFWKRTA